MHEPAFTDGAKAKFKAFSNVQQEQILDLIWWVCENPGKHHSGPIDDRFFTADRGGWRIIFTLSEDAVIVIVVAVGTSPTS
jgi:mRNA-degrading endonuclease RelE of RelBE toxin-antitoxin system